MSLIIETDLIPLRADKDGTVRVGGTRITLDTVVAAFNEGATAEEIVYQYPSLHLADVCAVISYYLRRRLAVISYYLRRRLEVEGYLNQRQKQASIVREQNEHRFDPHGVRGRLLARRS